MLAFCEKAPDNLVNKYIPTCLSETQPMLAETAKMFVSHFCLFFFFQNFDFNLSFFLLFHLFTSLHHGPSKMDDISKFV
jgi:hypothetical protein